MKLGWYRNQVFCLLFNLTSLSHCAMVVSDWKWSALAYFENL